MPPFPGHGLSAGAGLRIGRPRASRPGRAPGAAVGERVFVPGARCFGDVRGLFGGAASRVWSCRGRARCPIAEHSASRACCSRWPRPRYHAHGAATAHGRPISSSVMACSAACSRASPSLAAAQPPTVWERNPKRAARRRRLPRASIPTTDTRRDYRSHLRRQRRRVAARHADRAARSGRRDRARRLLRASRCRSRSRPPSCARRASASPPSGASRISTAVADAGRRRARSSLDGLITHRARRGGRGRGLPHGVRRSRLPEDDPRLESMLHEHVMRKPRSARRCSVHDSRCAPKPRSSPIRCRPTGDQGDADHRDLRQGRHRQELHARQPVLHDGAAGQEGAADRLRSEERHDLAAVRRPRLPDHHRDLRRRRSSPASRSRSATSASSATASSRWSSAAPRSAAAAAGAASSTASRLLEKLGFHDWGFDYVLLDFLGDVVCGGFGLPIARDMCQKVIVVGSQRPAVAVRRQQRLLGGRVLPQARRQCRRRRHGDQQGRRHRRGAGVRRGGRASRCWRRSPRNEDIRRKSANYEIIGRPGGQWAPLFEELADQRRRGAAGAAEAADAGRAARAVQRRGSRPRRGARAGDARSTCAASTRSTKKSLEVVYDDGLSRRDAMTPADALHARRSRYDRGRR